MEDKSKSYRDSMITATGIILGFLLNFETTWAKSEVALNDIGAYFVALTMLVGTVCLIAVLYRMLKLHQFSEKTEAYYNRTLLYFIFGISLAFVGVFVDMFSNFFQD
ncbi:MAG TPA: hypothetical protein PK971_01065 [Saprospiraceae bacterium]|nr:hypothetical protein [Saprospiraceae bacterium]HNG88676.1 hypothetical protein [Saprospiraceae bacterium]